MASQMEGQKQPEGHDTMTTAIMKQHGWRNNIAVADTFMERDQINHLLMNQSLQRKNYPWNPNLDYNSSESSALTLYIIIEV